MRKMTYEMIESYISNNYSVSEIAEEMMCSNSTIYRVLNNSNEYVSYILSKIQYDLQVKNDDLYSILKSMKTIEINVLMGALHQWKSTKFERVYYLSKIIRHIFALRMNIFDFNRTSVKIAFYRRSKKVHPDMKGGNCQDFIELRNSYQALLNYC